MSQTFTLQGDSSVLSVNYYPPIELDPNQQYCLGLIGLHTYNSIPNIEEGVNNKFIYHRIDVNKFINIPTGSYEVADIEKYLQKELLKENPKEEVNSLLSLKPNNNTLQCEIKSKFDIDFTSDQTIGKLLGFSNKLLKSSTLHASDLPVQIIKVNSVRIECNITTGAYYDDKLSHTLFEFSPSVDPGFAINIEPKNILYLPLNIRDRIDNITIRIIDEEGKLINFRGEKILVRLELKTWG